jgi:hypothetical protein
VKLRRDMDPAQPEWLWVDWEGELPYARLFENFQRFRIETIGPQGWIYANSNSGISFPSKTARCIAEDFGIALTDIPSPFDVPCSAQEEPDAAA